MQCQVKRKMRFGFFICLLIFGFTLAAEDNVVSETKESSKTNLNFRPFDKNKRGATRITNTDNPSFNHLTTTNTVSNTASSISSFKPSTVNSNPTPFRYLYNQQYYQPNPFLTYVQIPQASQIAAQYSFQTNPVTHFLQTPSQIQYVATPTAAQVPQFKYQTFSGDFSSTSAGTSDSSSSSAANSQYIPQSQASAASQTYASSASTGSSSTASASQIKQIQPVYYTQPPLLTFFQQPQTANFIYQQPNVNYLLRQQQQMAGIFEANRLGLYSPSQNVQLTYLVPMVVSQPEQDSTTTTTSNLKSSDKTLSNTQQPPSSNSFTLGTKA